MDWGICGIGVQPSNTTMRDALAAQDGLYTLVLRHSDGTWEPRVIGSIVEYLFAPDDPGAAIEKMADPATRIVSLTVTEGGYNLDAVTGEFDASEPSVLADLRPGAAPRTVFGLVTEALARRRDRGIPAFSILSCDNVQGNGHVSQRAFTTFARLRDPGLADWITRHVRFPNGMVDRITPQRGHPAAFLEDNRAVFGDLADDARFTRVYSSILTALLDGGVRKTFADLDHYTTERKPP
jgi:mannitol 2-dehydrogenase